jgi:Tfp pilus assembly PilM family ATPase/Tfp pilus assembly protein PilN
VANFIAIDLEPQGVYVVAGHARAAVKVSRAVAWTDYDGDPPPLLTPATAKEIGEKLRERLRAAGVAPAPVIVSVGRDRVILKELKYPPVPPTEEPALVRFQAVKEMSESPEDVVLDYAPLTANGNGEGERRSMAVLVRKDLFGAIQVMCNAAGLKLAAVTPRPYAVAAGLVRALASSAVTPPDEKGDAVAAVTLNPAGGEFTVVRNGEVTLTKAIPAPVIASAAMLLGELRRNLAVYASQHPGHPIKAVYLAEVGGGWAARLREALGLPLHTYDPLAGAAPEVDETLRGRFAGAVGLLAGRGTDALPINFVSPRQPKTVRDPARRRLALAALAAALVLFAGLAYGYVHVSDAESRVAELQERKTALKKSLDEVQPDAKRLKAIDGWSKREVVWVDELHNLAAWMPPGDSVRVTSYTGTSMPVGKDGKQEAQARLELKLAATGPEPVTTLMSNLERENTGGNKFYVGTFKVIIGVAGTSAGTKHNQLYNVITKVNHREPGQYAKEPPFTPPQKTWGGAGSPAAPK